MHYGESFRVDKNEQTKINRMNVIAHLIIFKRLLI